MVNPVLGLKSVVLNVYNGVLVPQTHCMISSSTVNTLDMLTKNGVHGCYTEIKSKLMLKGPFTYSPMHKNGTNSGDFTSTGRLLFFSSRKHLFKTLSV